MNFSDYFYFKNINSKLIILLSILGLLPFIFGLIDLWLNKDNFMPYFGPCINNENIKSACIDADMIIIHTEWNDFKALNFKKLSSKKNVIVYDMRNILSPDKMKKDKINYFGIGR